MSPQDFDGSIHQLIAELRAIVASELLWAAHMSYIVLEGSGEADCCFISQFIETDMSREEIHEDTDVFPTSGRWELEQVAADVLKNILRLM